MVMTYVSGTGTNLAHVPVLQQAAADRPWSMYVHGVRGSCCCILLLAGRSIVCKNVVLLEIMTA